MRSAVGAALFILLLANVSFGDVIPAYHTNSDFLLTSPGAMGFGLYGYANPAVLNYIEDSDMLFSWSVESNDWDDIDRWGIFDAGLFLGLPIGGGLIHTESDQGDITDYRTNVTFGNRTASFGIGYGWTTGAEDAYDRGNVVMLGSLIRPAKYVSIGAWSTVATSGDAIEGVADLAVRPFGDEKLSFFADYALQNDEKAADGHWSTGAAIELLPGVRVAGRYFDDESFTFGINFSLGYAGLISQAHYDSEQEHSYNTYGVRVGAYDRNVIRSYFQQDANYLKLELDRRVKYQRYRLFDDSHTLLNLISAIDAAKEDRTVKGVAINTAGLQINRELAWELREKLREFRSSGKKVIVFLEMGNIDTYHFASVADRIVMDQEGLLMLEGYVLGRWYLKGTLEKVGVGFDEWRFFEYKSSMETFSREKMSEADREQRQALADDWYRLAKSEICRDKDITPYEFDSLVNDHVAFSATRALDEGLVDTLGRWDTVKETIESMEGESKTLISAGDLGKYKLPGDDHWGEKPLIAVIYAIGVCAMEEGIAARKLVKYVEKARKDRRVKAVVLRVDSPGGDGLASDLVAEELKKCREKKPVIVSQGYVAASGGYWLSMYADTIVAAPQTVTGSIGVIGGWFYDQGLKEKLGMSTDVVQVGEHADLGFGIVLPLIDVMIPDRNLTEEERSIIESLIREFYWAFVEKVAKGRGMEEEQIDEIGQGRAWSGYDGLENGLVDKLGGLDTAVSIAKRKAGIPKEDDIRIVEYPKPALFDLSGLFGNPLLGLDEPISRSTLADLLKFRMERNGRPLPMLPLADSYMLLESMQY
jgi:protease-4